MPLPTTDYEPTKQHAVPQNIMSVEFKLIGSMTVRQFVYAAMGIIGAYLCYISGLPFIFKWPLVIIISLGGIGFAFLPVQDRGMDVWIRNFLMAISRPTRRVWHKEPLPPAFLLSDYATALKNEAVVIAPINSRAKLLTYLSESKSSKLKNKLDISEELFLEHLNFGVGTVGKGIRTTTTIVEPEPESLPVTGRALKIETPQEEIRVPKRDKQAKALPEPTYQSKSNLTEQVVDLKKLMEKIKTQQGGVLFEVAKPIPMPGIAVNPKPQIEEEIPPLLSAELKKLELETRASEEAALAEKEAEKQKQEQVAREFEEMKQSLTSPQPVAIPKLEMGLKPREVAETLKTECDITLSQVPNVVNGVVKDASGKMLQGVIVIVKDESGDPVRALKTNEVGQFVVSTPLPNGKYLVTASQVGKRFATMEVVADGRLLPPLSFVSKENSL